MRDSRFIPSPKPLRLAEVATLVGARLVRGDPETLIHGAAPLEAADAGDLSFLDNPRYVKHLASTRASACLCQKRYAERVPAGVAVLETAEPYRAYARYIAQPIRRHCVRRLLWPRRAFRHCASRCAS